MLRSRDKKVLEAKNLCRFCLESDKDIKCVSISKLYTFLKDPGEVLNLLGLEAQYSELLSEIVCEKCFQVLVDFDAYRKRCLKAQSDFVQEIQEIDEKIQEIRSSQKDENIWYKEEVIDEISMEEVVEEVEQGFDLIEEHLEDEVYDENVYDHSYPGYSIEDVTEAHSDDDDEMIEEVIEAHDFIFDKSIKVEQDEILNSKDKYEVVDKDEIIKNPERNSFAYRVYECFFCKLKFYGRKTYKVSKSIK